MDAPYLVLAIVTLLSTVPSAVFSSRELHQRDAEVRRVARYLVVRSVALMLVAVVPFVHHSRGWLAGVAVTMTLVQAADAVLGMARQRAVFVIGPAVTALVTVAALWWMAATPSV